MIDDGLLKAAQDSISTGSKSFSAATRLLPKDIRDCTTLLYAWCRHCDDLVDGQCGGGDIRPVDDVRDAVSVLRLQTERAVFGQPEGMPFMALSAVVREKHLDPQYIFDHLAGYEMDASLRRYLRFEDTLEYAYHVAGTVGVMMAQIMGVKDREHQKYASDLGIAFQLTNIARDVVEDAQAGRCYLPKDWLYKAGLTVEDLHTSRALPESQNLAKRLLDHAEPFYASARSGLAVLPEDCRWGIASALAVYRDIGRGVRRASPVGWSNRVSTSRIRKLSLIGGCLLAVKTRKQGPAVLADRSTLWTPAPLRSKIETGSPRQSVQNDQTHGGEPVVI